MLGKIVTVTVDRPLGSCHPTDKNMIYPVNYGYVEGVFAGDGEEQDAYILGVQEPIPTFTGRVIAIAKRNNDVEDKWIVASEDAVFYEPDIKKAIDFQEQYFKTDYQCLYEKVCGAVLYTVQAGVRQYLLIKNESGHIGFAKGHVEYGENECQTALREIREETGLKVSLLDGFREEYDYKIADDINKKAVYFMSEFNGEDIKIQQSEILDYWLVPFQQALELINFEPDRQVLRRADSQAGKMS